MLCHLFPLFLTTISRSQDALLLYNNAPQRWYPKPFSFISKHSVGPKVSMAWLNVPPVSPRTEIQGEQADFSPGGSGESLVWGSFWLLAAIRACSCRSCLSSLFLSLPPFSLYLLPFSLSSPSLSSSSLSPPSLSLSLHTLPAH